MLVNVPGLVKPTIPPPGENLRVLAVRGRIRKVRIRSVQGTYYGVEKTSSRIVTQWSVDFGS
jgi:hypothetical protein